MITILDCYTDEAAGLGVPPYLGTYPRYLLGKYPNSNYITIDDLRALTPKKQNPHKTDIFTYNKTRSSKEIKDILSRTESLIIVLGVHVPGKYLSAVPGTVSEVIRLIKDLDCEKILTGPAVFGTQLHGGKAAEKYDLKVFDKIDPSLYKFSYDETKDLAIKGAATIKQIPLPRVVEIETGRGCDIGKCSFCTEPIKNRVEYRETKDIVNEIIAIANAGAQYFRLGKQTCFYSFPEPIKLLKEIRNKVPKIKVLHIDNVNPVKVIRDKDEEITKAVAKYCTSGNIAAFGVESFDPEVVKQNTLNTSPTVAYKAVKIINKHGKERGPDGMPKYLPGINVIFGLAGETKKTHSENMQNLKRFLDENLLLRRINIRRAAIFDDTKLKELSKDQYLGKCRKFYWKWRNDIRQKIDLPMLKLLCPTDTVIKNCITEIHDGKTTFARQYGTYPLIIGIKEKLPLQKEVSIRITDHMLRSLTGIVENE